MKLMKCSNNHFYNGDKFSECPHCFRSSIMKKAQDKDEAQVEYSSSDNASQKQPINQEAPQTGAMWEPSYNSSDDKTEAAIYRADVNTMMAEPGIDTQLTPEYNTPIVQEKDENNNAAASVGSLQEAVNVVKSTVVTEDTKTMAFYNLTTTEPVVGWLVCIKGEYIGEGFNLKTGRNMIGRSLKMDVPLAKEPSVSRDRHAVITYEPKKRKFYIQPGESNGLTYVNDELLMLPRVLKDREKIQLGNSEFVFIAFCGESFTWEDYI